MTAERKQDIKRTVWLGLPLPPECSNPVKLSDEEMNNAIGSASVLGNKHEPLPDGKYQMGVYGVEIKPSSYVDGSPNFIMEAANQAVA